jgi:hypothetical protein
VRTGWPAIARPEHPDLFSRPANRYIARMNAYDRDLGRDLATLHYGDGEYAVLKPGRHVICAVSGLKIPLEALRYWNAELQEAYAGPAEALQRWRELNP